MMIRNTLTDDNIGQHRGLPATIVITVDLKDLDPTTSTGVGTTGGGLMIPINDVLKIGRHARHYVAVLHHGKPINLYEGRTKRLATAGQRLMLHASQRGCTHPRCTRGGYYAQVHHANTDWLDGGPTDIDNETFACDIHHAMVGPGKWRTRLRDDGICEWIPPKNVDPEQKPRINRYHFPERVIRRAA